jgi:hypothetical protein
MSGQLQVEQFSVVRFDPENDQDSGRDNRWYVHIVNNMVCIGVIAWYHTWEQFAYFTFSTEILEEIRLREIAKFLERKNKIHKQGVRP